MSAFCGLFYLDNNAASATRLQKMLVESVAWQPDAKGHWVHEGVGLAQATRYNTPESLFETMPLRVDHDRLVLVCDARLDNRESLANQLDIDKKLSEVGDGELILAAYEKWGEQCPVYLLGDFAFAIWDKAKREIFCARDHMGQRLLYYHVHANKRVAFATTAAGIFALRDVAKEVNEQKLVDFSLLMCPDPEATFYKGLMRLPPAHTMVISSQGVKTRRYWSYEQSSELNSDTEDEVIEQFKEIFSQAVNCRLRSAYPLGAHLSGGLDSSSVSAVAANWLGRRNEKLYTFGSVPRKDFEGPTKPGWNNDDSYYMALVAGSLPNVQMNYVVDEEPSPFASVNSFYRYSEGPMLNPCNRTWMEAILRQASGDGIRTLLTGAMGNATLSFRGEGARSTLAQVKSRVKTSMRLTRRIYQTHILRQMPWATYSMVARKYANAHQLFERHRAYSWAYGDPRRWMIFNGIIHDAFAAQNAHRALYGVESVDPTHDKRVVEFCLSLPPRHFAKKGMNRLLVRNAMKGILPDEVRLRQSRGKQAAEWFHRLNAIQSELAGDVDAFWRSPILSRCFDLKRMSTLVNAWPRRQIVSSTDETNYRFLFLRSLSLGHFVDLVEERR
jgi:asparagine synthase (glutamine-hydrolysing)